MIFKKLSLAFLTVIASVCFFTGCQTKYYELWDIPKYAPLNDGNFKKAECYAVYPYETNVITESARNANYNYFSKGVGRSVYDDLLIEQMKKRGLRVEDFSKCLSLNMLDKVEHIIQVFPLEYTWHRIETGYAITYRLVVMLRRKSSVSSSGKIMFDNMRFFQAYHRKFLAEAPVYKYQTETVAPPWWKPKDTSPYPFFSKEQVTPLFENLFNNPEFRKALQPCEKSDNGFSFPTLAPFSSDAEIPNNAGSGIAQPGYDDLINKTPTPDDMELFACLAGRWKSNEYVAISKFTLLKPKRKTVNFKSETVEELTFLDSGEFIKTSTVKVNSKTTTSKLLGKWKILNGCLYLFQSGKIPTFTKFFISWQDADKSKFIMTCDPDSFKQTLAALGSSGSISNGKNGFIASRVQTKNNVIDSTFKMPVFTRQK